MCTVDPLYCEHYDSLASKGKKWWESCEGKCGMPDCAKLHNLTEKPGEVVSYNCRGCGKTHPTLDHVLLCILEGGTMDKQADKFITKDSGERQEFSTGMKRDTQTNKPRYDLVDIPMLKRWAELMARGAEKYGENNWRKAATEEEMNRFAASLLRHTFQLLEGDRTEDHGAAICFNAAGYEMVREKIYGKA